jgi:type IV pilus assembly protein PilY1
MLVMGRDHKLYYEAYNDASDLNDDGVLDVGYRPEIEYYGYFDSYKVYTYSTVNQRFEPLRETATKKVNPGASNEWSGDFLNYLTMSRMDAMRKVLYGGYRSTDTATETVLERAYIPQEAHTWGKEYESVARDGYDIRDYTPLELPGSSLRHLFASTSLVDSSNAAYKPLLRVLPDNTHRIWQWVSKERPVADDSLEATSSVAAMPADNAAFTTMQTNFAVSENLLSTTASLLSINASGSQNTLALISGNITITTQGYSLPCLFLAFYQVIHVRLPDHPQTRFRPFQVTCQHRETRVQYPPGNI